ncbi:hypothetical protein [Methanosarcina acetivorans]|nr:hypothetical protein [Methanosarcina acetivorans]
MNRETRFSKLDTENREKDPENKSAKYYVNSGNCVNAENRVQKGK